MPVRPDHRQRYVLLSGQWAFGVYSSGSRSGHMSNLNSKNQNNISQYIDYVTPESSFNDSRAQPFCRNVGQNDLRFNAKYQSSPCSSSNAPVSDPRKTSSPRNLHPANYSTGQASGCKCGHYMCSGALYYVDKRCESRKW